MADSRPMRSETQPNTGRVKPPVIRSSISADASAVSVTPPIVRNGTSATPKSAAIGASWAVINRPGIAPTVIIA